MSFDLRDCLLQQLTIQIETHRHDVAALSGAEHAARAANLQIAHGDLESGAEFGELLDRSAPELTAQAEELVTAETGLVSLAGPARARVTNRAGWVGANVASFQRLLRPLLDKFEARMTSTSMAPITRKAAGAEMGAMLLGRQRRQQLNRRRFLRAQRGREAAKGQCNRASKGGLRAGHLAALAKVLWKKSKVALVARKVASRVAAGVWPMKLWSTPAM